MRLTRSVSILLRCMILSLMEVLMMSLQILRAAHSQFPRGDFPVLNALYYLPSGMGWDKNKQSWWQSGFKRLMCWLNPWSASCCKDTREDQQ